VTPDAPNSPRDELEARITALLLGELSAEEAAALRQAIDQDPELARLENQLKETIGLVREAASAKDAKPLEPAAALQLSAERREKLLASFKTTSLHPAGRRSRRAFSNKWSKEWLKVAAMVMALHLLGAVLLFSLRSNKIGQEVRLRMIGAVRSSDKAPSGNALAFSVPSSEKRLAKVAPFAGESVNAPANGDLREGAYFAGVPPSDSALALAQEESVRRESHSSERNRYGSAPPAAPRTPGATPSQPSDSPQVAQSARRPLPAIALPPSPAAETDNKPEGYAVVRGLSDRYVTTTPNYQQLEELREGLDSRSGLAGRPDGFRGGGAGGGRVEVGGPGGEFNGQGRPAAEYASVSVAPNTRLATTPAPALTPQAPPAPTQPNDSVQVAQNGSGARPNIALPASPPAETAGVALRFSPDGKQLEQLREESNKSKELADGRGFGVGGRGGGIGTGGYAGHGSHVSGIQATPAPTTPQPLGEPAGEKLAGQKTVGAAYVNGSLETNSANGSSFARVRGLERDSFGWFDDSSFGKNAASAGNVTGGSPTPGGSLPGEFPQQIPTRPVRTQSTATPDASDPAVAYINMAIQKQQMESKGRPMPELPPIPGFDADQEAKAVATTIDPGKDVNGSAEAPVGRASARADFGSAPATAVTANPAPAIQPNTGLPMPTGVRKSETEIDISNVGAVPTREKNLNATGVVQVGQSWADRGVKLPGDVTILSEQQAGAAATPSPLAPAPAKPAETRALAQKEDPKKTTSSLDDLGVLIESGTNSLVASDFAIFTNAGSVSLANVSPGQPTAGASANFSLSNPGLFGASIADPTHGTGDGREWGIRKKLDADGDSLSRIDGLKDLTKKEGKEIAAVQDKLGKVDNSNPGGVVSAEAVGYVNTPPQFAPVKFAPAKSPPVTNEELKKQVEDLSLFAGVDSAWISILRTNGATGGVTVNYATTDAAAKPVSGGFEFQALTQPLEKKRNLLEIALPPGHDVAQGAERELRVQSGPVAVNEIQLQPPVQERSYAQRLKIVDRARSGTGETAEAQRFSQRADDEAGTKLAGAVKRAEYDLETAKLVQEKLQKRVWAEKVDQALPRSAIVQIVDRAEAPPAKGSSLWGQISGAFSGNSVATARVAATKESTEQALLSRDQVFDPYWAQTELEKIQSKAVLEKAVEKLSLNETWAKQHGGSKLSTEETIQLLKKKLDVRKNPKWNTFDIQARSEDPNEAARIANAVAEAYRDTRLQGQKEMSAEGLRQLSQELAKNNKQIAQLEQELESRKKEQTPEQADVSPPKLAPTAGIPQPEVNAAENNFSTFSLNVSDVSFKLAAASLEKGQMPDPSTVRSEEFINAFDYRDPEPKGSAPIAFAWERARYPFAHNRDLLRFSVKTAASGRQPGRPFNLVLLLDNSGSMERADRVRIRQECLRVLGRQLRPEDRVSVVAFARTARLVLDGISGRDGANLPQWAGELAPDGGTNLEDAMNVAYQAALRHFLPNGVNRVVLLTDGAANLGDVEPESLKKKVEANRKQGIALDCFGIGWDGYNDDLLEVLSRNGDGRYGFVNTPEAAVSEFAGQLAGALRVAASDVKVQVEFNPRRVTAYRQIGYAKHQLKKEQFRDNTVDAAEIGAAEQGNALYTVQVNPNGEGPLGIVRVRFKVPGTADYREHEWALPYSGAATPLEQSSPALRLAATASAFSEWLVSSPFAGEVTPDRLLGTLSGVPETCAADPRPKMLEWMIRQAKSLAGK